MAESHADLDQLPERTCPEGAGGEEADLHNHVPDNIFRMAERPGPLRDALEARAAASKYSVQTIFSRLLAHCFIRFSRENVDLAAALLTLACLGEGKEVSWAHEPHLRSLLGRHSIREACRYIPAGVSAEKLAEIERWRCDSRTAACACLLLLCATRETLAQGAEALQLAKALTEVCAALGRHSGQDIMAWGCDLDPGNLGAHMSALAGGTPHAASALEKLGAAGTQGEEERAGMSSSLAALSLSGQDAMQTLSSLCKGAAADAPVPLFSAAASGAGPAVGETAPSGVLKSPAVISGSEKHGSEHAKSLVAAHPIDQSKVDQLMQKLDEQLQLLRQATPLLRQRAKQLTDTQAAEVREQLALVLDQQTDQFEESMTALRDSLPKLQLPVGDLDLSGLGWPTGLPSSSLDASSAPAGLGQVQTAPAMNGRGEAQPAQQSADSQATPQAVLPAFADGAEPFSAGLGMNNVFTKGVSEALKGVENGCCHLPCSDEHILSSLGLPPDPSFSRPRSERRNGSEGQALSTETSTLGLAAEGCTTAAAAGSSGELAAPCGNAAVSPAQAGRLPGSVGNPLPSRRAGPAARSHSRRSMREIGLGVVEEEGKVQATWAFIRAAVPLLKQAVGGKLEQSSQQVAPQLCCALARLCAQSTQGGRAFAAHIFKECAAHLAKLAKSEETRAAAGPALLLCQLVLSEQPAPSKARYPPVPPSSTLKISSVFVQLGVVDALRQRLSEAADQLKPSNACSRGAYFGSPDSEGIVAVACDALAIFALNPASHRSLHAAATFQSTLNLLNALHGIDKARLDLTETKELALELVRALAAHCPSVAESAALWGLPGLLVLSTYLKQGNDAALREAAAAALDAILRLHKIQAVKEVLAKGMRIRGLLDKYDAVRGENLRFFPELRHRVAKMLRVLAYDSGGAALPELLRPGKDGCVPWLVHELGNLSTHWCTRAELAAVLGSLARIPALSAAMARSRRSVAGKDIMLDPRAGIRKAGAMQPLMALLREVVENKTHALNNEIVVNALAGVVGVGITYIKDDEDIIPLLKVELLPQLLKMMDVKTMTGSEGQRKLTLGNATILAYCLRWAGFREEFVKRDGHVMATDLMLWCSNNEPVAPAPGKDDFHMETVCTLVNIIGNAARSSVKALEYVNKQGGLPVAARYLARAVALPPSNTSWYMGLSNGAAGLCDLQAIVVSNPKVAAAVAEICMVGLAATVQATKGPPKPDKARIDRLAYVVTSLSTLATYLKASAPKAIASALEQGTFQQLLDLKRTLHLSNATIGYLQAFVMSSRNPSKDAAAANASMCALLEEEAAEKERELREAAKRAKRRAKKANARLQRLQEEAGAMPAAGEPEIDTPDEGPSQAAQGEDSRETDEELPEQNGMSPEDVSGPEEGAEEPEILPESWEAMGGDAAGCGSAHEFVDAFSVSSEMGAALGGSPDSGSWTTVGIKKAPPSTAHTAAAAPAPAAERHRAPASPARAAQPGDASPSAPAAGQSRAGAPAQAVLRDHTVSMLKAQAGAPDRQPAGESNRPSAPEAENGSRGSSWSKAAVHGLPAKALVSPAALDANGAGELPPHAAWAGNRGTAARPGHAGPARAGAPLRRQGSPQLSSSLFSEPQTLSSRTGVHVHSESGHHSPVSSSRLSTAGAPESPMSAFEAPASLLGRLSSGAEQPILASMASPTPEQALGLPGNLSPAVPSPGSLFFATPGSLPALPLWSPATQHSTADSQHAGDWMKSAAALPPPAAAQAASLWGGSPLARPSTSLYSSSSIEVSAASHVPESRWQPSSGHNCVEQLAHIEQQPTFSGAATLPDLAADPWSQHAGPAGGHVFNPWSTGFGGLQPDQAQHSVSHGAVGGSVSGVQAVRGSSSMGQASNDAPPLRVVSQLNPAAGEYLGSGPVPMPAHGPGPGPGQGPAAAAPASSRAPPVPPSSNIWGAHGLFGAPPIVPQAPQPPHWDATSSGQQHQPQTSASPAGAASSSQWSLLGPLQQPMLATSGPLDWGQGASPPFSDAPLFLSSMMQQILPEEDIMQEHGVMPLHSSRGSQYGRPEHHTGVAAPPLPTPSAASRAYDSASGPATAAQRSAAPGIMMQMPPGYGQAAGSEWAGPGTTAPGARHATPQPQYHSHAGVQLPAPALEKRPSDLLHAVAQASQQARAQANNIQRYKPSGTPSAAIAHTGSQSQAARSPLQMQRREAFAAAAMTPGRPSERLHALNRPGNGSSGAQ